MWRLTQRLHKVYKNDDDDDRLYCIGLPAGIEADLR